MTSDAIHHFLEVRLALQDIHSRGLGALAMSELCIDVWHVGRSIRYVQPV